MVQSPSPAMTLYTQHVTPAPAFDPELFDGLGLETALGAESCTEDMDDDDPSDELDFYSPPPDKTPAEIAAQIAQERAWCGSQCTTFSGATGAPVDFIFFCGHWRPDEHGDACTCCLDYRISLDKDRFDRMVARGPVRITEFPDKPSAAKYTRALRLNGHASEYAKYPMDDKVMVIVDESAASELDVPGLTISRFTEMQEWKQNQNWDAIAQTPLGSKRSGALGREKLKERAPDTVTIAVPAVITPHYTINGKPVAAHIINECVRLAMVATADLDPHTPEEILESLHARCDAVESQLSRHSIKAPGRTYRNQSVNLSSIFWKQQPTHANEKFDTDYVSCAVPMPESPPADEHWPEMVPI